METRKLGRVWSSQFIDMTRNLTEEVSKFKNTMFRSTISATRLMEKDVDRLMSVFGTYLRYWEDYSNELVAGMANCRAEDVNVSTINYDDIKDFVYAKYDYASVLQFADGVFRGVKEAKFKSSNDIHDFFDHTVSEAFDDMDPSIAGIMDTFISATEHHYVVDNLGFNYFKTVKNNKKLFNSRTRTELYKAIEKTVRYLVEHISELTLGTSYNDTRITIGSINKILEYAELSAVVYAGRIYALGMYIYPFTEVKANRGEVSATMESVAPNYDDVRYHIFRDADDAIIRGPGETELLIKKFDEMVDEIAPGSREDANGRWRSSYNSPYIGANTLQGNAFCGKMLDNPVFYRVATCREYDSFRIATYDGVNEKGIRELAEFLKAETYNQRQALSSTDTARNGILHIIRGTDAKKETFDAYKELMFDLRDCAITLCCGMSRILTDLSSAQQKTMNTPVTSLPAMNTGAECLRLLSYLYRDITAAIIQKARYIELKLSELAAETEKKVFQDVSVRVPGGLEDEGINIDDTMMCAVPDTTRMPVDLLDLYALPAFEEMQMFDDFLRANPMFEHDMYLTEAFNFASLINAIISMIRGSFNRFKVFVNDKGVQGAIKWTIDNEQKLRNMNFNGKSMKARPFKSDENGAEKIDISATAKNLIDKINGFKDEDASSDEKVKAFVRSLYPSDQVYNIWAKSTDDKVSTASYKNFVLYGTEGELVPDEVEYAANDLQKKVGEWVTTVKGADQALKAHGQLAIEMEKAVNGLKAKLVTLTNAANRQNTQNTDGQEKKEGDTSGTQDQKQQDASSAKDVLISSLLGETQTAVRRLWDSSAAIFKEYIMTEYGYIKYAHGIANR